jgi:hypothetical protein
MSQKAKIAALIVSLALSACGGGGGDAVVIPPFWNQGGVVAVDLDGDGRVDVAVATAYVDGPPPHSGFVEVYLQTAAGGFDAPVRYPVGPDPWGLSAGDVDGDGRLDLIVATPRTVAPQINVINDSGGVSVLRQDPVRAGRFLASQWIATGGSAEDAATAPLDANAGADLIVADGVTVNSRALVLPQNPVVPGQFLAPIGLPTGSASGSQDVAVGDVNGDGLSDVVLAASSAVVVFYQRAGGGFAAPVGLPAGLSAQGVAIADLDGDGRTDIVAANVGNAPAGLPGGAGATVFLQTGPGVFVATQIALPDGARRAAVGDLNGDGVPDIAVSSITYQALFTPSTVTILVQSAAQRGQFTVAGTYAGTPNGGFLAIGDVNGDGHNDVILSDGPGVLVQRAGAPGTFDTVRALR